ncbi:MAG: nuclear transport factor 2 family protein [Thermoplasmata archaeon]|nr:nuclear transport factor 2 family protein [Thermoplasmata archaeon]
MEISMTQLTEQHARQIFADVNTRNVDKIVDNYAEGASFQVPSLDAPLVGKEAIRTYLTSSLTAFPDWSMDVNHVIVAGQEAVVVNSVHGTHTGPYTTKDGKSVEPTNKKLNQDQLTRVVVNEDGKVSMFRSYGNPSSINRMLRPPTPAVTTHTETTTSTHTRGAVPAP